MAQDPIQMTANAALEADLRRATTPEEIRQLLENAVSRSGIADRDPVTGRFIPRDPQAAAQTANTQDQAEEDGEQVFSKTITINGKELTFEAASEVELEQQIGQAYRVAEAVRPAEPGAFASVRQNMENAALRAAEDVELRLKFQRGEIDAATYIEQSGALDQALAARGFDIEQASNTQYEISWREATDTFLQGPGSDWPGGPQMLRLIGTQVVAMGLADADDKVGALAAAWAEMKKNGLIISPEPSAEQLEAETANMTPQEIIEKFKQATGNDPDSSNQSFMKIHSSTGSSSSLFGR